MKKAAVFILFLLLASAVWGQNYKWTGEANDGVWTNTANWAANGTTETIKDINGADITLTYNGFPSGGIFGAAYFVIEDVNGNNVPLPNNTTVGGGSGTNVVIKKGTLVLNGSLQCTNLIIEGGTLIRNNRFIQVTGKIKMTSGILDLNGDGSSSINVPSTAWDITGGIIIRDNVASGTFPNSPTINDDNVIDIGGTGGGTNFIWTGGAGNDWDTATNWIGGVPANGANTKIIINSSTSPANIPLSVTCGTFIIAKDASFNLVSSTLTVNSLFENEGTFTSGTSNVVLSGTISVKGDNTFYNLTCTGATVKFENGKTQAITGDLTASGSTLNAINNATPHWNLNLTGATVVSSPSNIAWCNSTTFLNWSSFVTDGGNNINVFTNANPTFVWTGATDTAWTTGTNWVGGTSPLNGTSTDIITINTASTNHPVYSGTGLVCDTLMINAGKSLDMGASNLTVTTTFENNGNLILTGSGSQSVTITTVTGNGTVTYNNNGTHLAGLTSFNNLTIQNGARTVTGAVTVSGNLNLAGGSLNAASINVTGTSDIAGNVTTTGTQTYTGAVTLGDDVTLQGSTVTLDAAIAGSGKSLTITGNGVLNGGSVGALSVVSGNFSLLNNPLTATSVAVSGTSNIAANITTTGNQNYGTGNVTLGGTGTRTLTSSGGSVSASGIVSGAGVTVNALQGITLTGANTLSGNITLNNTQTGTASGNIAFNNTSATINLTAINNSSSGNININQTGNLSITSLQTATPGGNVSIEATGAVTQAGAITTGALTLAGTGSYTLINSANSASSLHTTGASIPSIQYTNNAALSLGALQAGTITLQSSGAVTQTGAITTGALTLAGTGSYTLTNSANSASTLQTTGTTIPSINYTNSAALALGTLQAGAITLQSSGAVTQAGAITTGALTLAGTGSYTLTNSANSASSLHTTGTSITNIEYTNNNTALTLGALQATTNIIVKTGGSLTQTATINANNLTVEAGSSITLGEDNNAKTVSLTSKASSAAQGNITYNSSVGAANTLKITAADTIGNITIIETSGGLDIDDITKGANVNLKADKDLKTAGITDSGSVTLETTNGDITVSGNITFSAAINTANKVTLIAGGKVTVSGNISAYQLTAKAVGIVSVNAVTIDSSNSGNEGENAAIYIEASSFVVTPGTPDSIVPGRKTGAQWGQLCLVLNTEWANTGGVVDGAQDTNPDNLSATGFRWHQHITINLTGKHLVYGKTPQLGSITIPGSYEFVSESNVQTTFILDANYNVYIYDASSNHTSGLTFETKGTGTIEFYEENSFKKLSLKTESGGGIKFVDADVKVTEDFELLHNEKLTLATASSGLGKSSIEAAKITLNSITAESNESLTLKSTSGDINLNGTVGTLALPIGDIVLDSKDKVSILGALFANSLGVTSTGVINIGANITTTGSNPSAVPNYVQYYGAAVTLGGDVNFTGIAGSTVFFNSTVNGTTSARNLTVTTANVIFNGAVGSSTSLIGNVNVYTGTVNINADITTTGTQNYTGDVTLGGSGTVRTLTGTTVTLGTTIGSGKSLIITGNGVLNGEVTGIGGLTVSGTATLGGTGKRTITSSGNIQFESTLSSSNEIELSAANITIGGHTNAKQLIAKAPTGTVSVNAITIVSATTGNEGENAAIYIVANTFTVTTTTVGSIVPGGKLVQWGQLCLELQNKWLGDYTVVDGDEDQDSENLSPTGYRWHQHFPGSVAIGKMLYSFTEDSNGNGYLDRIRVQTNKALKGDFSSFNVSVVGYEIDTAKGTNGFEMVNVNTGKTIFDNDSFYIYVKEKKEIDGGIKPRWSITRNNSLMYASGALDEPINDLSEMKYIDTIPPRIAYTITLPGHPHTYVKMTELVMVDPSGNVSASFDGSTFVDAKTVQANLGYLFDHSETYDVTDLFDLPPIHNNNTSTAGSGYFQINNIFDKEDPNWTEIDTKNPPKYPLNWGYKEYAKVTDKTTNAQGASGTVPIADVFTPPNKLLTVDMMSKLANGQGTTVTPSTSGPVTRRVTDVLVSMVPNANGDNYFVWPMFAKPTNDDHTVGYTEFNGTAYLDKETIEDGGIELQASINSSLTIIPELFWTTSKNKKIGELWLSDELNNIPNILYYFSPLYSGIKTETAIPVSSSLFNFDIDASDLADSGTIFEFIFRSSSTSEKFVARLDAPPNTIPDNWYALIRPFGFTIQGMSYQRGGVTIQNNVINSDKKETAIIRYDLPRTGRVTIQIYTLDGTLVKSIRRNESRDAGTYVDTWDGSNNGGRAVARGMYFVRVVGPDIDEIRKIMVVK